MKKKVVLGLIIVLSLFVTYRVGALSNGEIEDKTEKINKYENIVFLGDSIFDWYPVDKIFQDLPIVNSGMAGNTTEWILNNMENRVYRYNPTKVFLNIGTNDIELEDNEETNDKVVNNITKIVENIKKNRKKCEVYLISIYPVNNNLPGAHDRHASEIKEINARLKEYCATTKNAVYIDAFSGLVNSEDMLDEAYTEDGLHPNHLGYAKLTEILMKYIYQ